MLRFRPDVKPPQWGPMPEVQYTVKINAERMGIDPDKFVQYLPVWERGGVRLQDVFGNPDYVVGNDPANYGWNVWGLNRTAGIADPSVGLVKPAIVGGRFTILQEIAPSVTWGRWYLANRSELGFQVQSSTLRLISAIRATSSNVITSTRSHIPGQLISAAMSWDGTTFKAYSDGLVDGITTPNTPDNLQSGQMSLLGSSYSSGSNGATGQYIHIADILTPAQIKQLYYEPYTLLMPMSRPVYFDMGGGAEDYESPLIITTESTVALLGQKGAAGPATVTASASLGMGGVKTILSIDKEGQASFGATSSFTSGGTKSTSSPLTLQSVASFLASGILELLGLDREGGASFLSSASFQSSGEKEAKGEIGLTIEPLVLFSGTKIASCQFNINGIFDLGLDGKDFTFTFLPEPKISIPSTIVFGDEKHSSIVRVIALPSRIGVDMKIPQG